MSTVPHTNARSARRRLLAGILFLILLTAVLQGGSVGHGLVLDDYNHRAELREGDWSFRSLVDASHLGDPRRRVRMWWQEQADLHFFRPVAFLLMRANYVVGDWRPEVMHLGSLAWGVVCASLVLVLGRLATGSFGWGLLAATLFLLHPNNFLAPRWIACQNEQMATAFTLTALLCYGSYAGWWSEKPGSRAALAVALLCYMLALGCRESAIILPALLAVGDFSNRQLRTASAGSGANRHGSEPGLARLVPGYLLFGCLAIAYLVVRHQMLGPLTIPGRPYAWPAGEPGFLPFIAEKFVYYVLGLWAFLPIVGFAGQEQMRSTPVIFYGLFAAITLGWIAVLAAMYRRRLDPASPAESRNPYRQIWLWLAVALMPLGPVLPVFASAHHLYLASAGMAIATVLALRFIIQWSRERASSVRKALRVAIFILLPVKLAAFAGVNFALDQGVAGLAAACQLPIRQTVLLGGHMQPDDKLFFINLPMLAFNCMPAIEEAREVTPLHGYVLTFAPGFLGMDRPAHVEQLDEHRLRVWLNEPAYFSGLIGKSILQGINRDGPFRVGETFTTDEFTVEVTRADDQGVQEFLFTFPLPLNDPSYHFFLSSPLFDAYPLKFK